MYTCTYMIQVCTCIMYVHVSLWQIETSYIPTRNEARMVQNYQCKTFILPIAVQVKPNISSLQPKNIFEVCTLDFKHTGMQYYLTPCSILSKWLILKFLVLNVDIWLQSWHKTSINGNYLWWKIIHKHDHGQEAFLNLHNRPPTQLHKPVHNLQPVCRRHSARHHQRVCWWRPAFPAGCCQLGSHLAHGLALTVNATKTVVMSFQRQQRLQITINHKMAHCCSRSPPTVTLASSSRLTYGGPTMWAQKYKKRLDASFSSCGVSATRFINQHWSVCIQSTYDQYWNMDHSCFPVCPRRLTTDWRASNGMLDVSAWVFLYSSLPTTALSSTTRHCLPSLPAVNTDN